MPLTNNKAADVVYIRKSSIQSKMPGRTCVKPAFLHITGLHCPSFSQLWASVSVAFNAYFGLVIFSACPLGNHLRISYCPPVTVSDQLSWAILLAFSTVSTHFPGLSFWVSYNRLIIRSFFISIVTSFAAYLFLSL